MKEPFVPETSTYSVSKRRATTEDERAAQANLIECLTLPERLRARAGSVAESGERWRVDRVEDRVVLRFDTSVLELDADEARELAETILRLV